MTEPEAVEFVYELKTLVGSFTESAKLRARTRPEPGQPASPSYKDFATELIHHFRGSVNAQRTAEEVFGATAFPDLCVIADFQPGFFEELGMPAETVRTGFAERATSVIQPLPTDSVKRTVVERRNAELTAFARNVVAQNPRPQPPGARR